MKKSEMIRQAALRVLRWGRREDERRCYCTPSRNMVRSLNEEVTMNNLNSFDRQSTVAELVTTVAEKLRETLGRTHPEPLEHLDRDFDVSDEVVTQAFEKAALMYEEHGD